MIDPDEDPNDECAGCGAPICASCGGCLDPDPPNCREDGCICPGRDIRPGYMPADRAVDDAVEAAQERDDEPVDELAFSDWKEEQ